MKKQNDALNIVIVYGLAFALTTCSFKAKASDFDIDWPTSGNGEHVMAIYIDGCATKFKIKDKDLQAFRDKVDNDKEFTSDLIKKAREHAANGCKGN